MFLKKLTALASILILSMALATGCAEKPAETNTDAPAQETPSETPVEAPTEVVDVRPEKQVSEEGMISGAINVPFDAIEANLDKLPQDKTIAVYCNTGTKSIEAAKQLEALGYTNIVNSIDGVKEFSFELIK